MAVSKYLSLVKRFPLRPIRTEAELEAATAVLDTLTTRDLTPDEQDYLEVLARLIVDYESVHDADLFTPQPDGDMLQFLAEQHGKSIRTVARETGIAQPTLLAVVRGERRFTRGQVEKLALYFHVSPEVFSGASAKRRIARSRG